MTEKEIEILVNSIANSVDRIDMSINKFLAHMDEQITGIQTRKERQLDEEEEVRRLELENRKMSAENNRRLLELEALELNKRIEEEEKYFLNSSNSN